MRLDLLKQLGEIQHGFFLTGKAGTVVQIIEQMLVGIGASGSILGEGLEHAHVPFGGHRLMEAPLYHRQFVVSRSGSVTDADVFAQQVGGLR